jgi:hypothetical protein
MGSMLALLFAPSDRPIDRGTYLKAGVALMVLKYGVDAAVIGIFAGVTWTPLHYLVPMLAYNGETIAAFPSALKVWLLLWTLPFIWIGVSLSVRRCLDAGVFPGIVVLFFVPFFNYLLMFALALAPPKHVDAAVDVPAPVPPSRIGHRGRLGVLAGAVTGLGVAGLGVMTLRTHGATVFMGTPFLIGLVSAIVANRLDRKSRSETIVIGQLALVATGGTFVLFAFEGLICLGMALPLASPITMLGSMAGYMVTATRRPPSLSGGSLVLLLLLAGAGIDAAMPAPAGQVVVTSVDIDAPAAVVWQKVVSFGDITTPPRWYLRTGLAYPLRARLEGAGVGAVRRCEFTTGAFIEPITVWDEPRRLAFDVVSQPPPLQEWSPYTRVYAPHLDGFFRTSHGEFRLIALGDRRTRLEGRTWYTLEMQPVAYWSVVADGILHAIHTRVLEHIKSKAES